MSAVEAQDAKAILLQSNDEYRQLADRHHLLDHRLHELSDRPRLSDAEQLEESTIKKRKLALKDRMEQIVVEWARDHLASTS